MAENGKYLTEDSGGVRQHLAINTSAGAADVDKIGRLNELGQWDETMLPNAEVQTKTAFETLAAGDLVHMRSDGEIEKANATTSAKPASGFVKVGITAAAAGPLYGEGIIGGFVGLTIGGDVWLDTTAGIATQTPPSSSGNIVQKVGVAWSATEVKFEAGQTIELV